MLIKDIMEPRHKTINVKGTVTEAFALMRSEQLDVLPVVSDNFEFLGLVRYSSISELRPEDLLDEALEETFPASDPISPG